MKRHLTSSCYSLGERENGMVKSVPDQQFINSSNGFARSPGPTLKEYLFFFFELYVELR